MADRDHTPPDDDGRIGRRGMLKCMAWAGTGVLWTVSGGVASSMLVENAAAQPMAGGLNFIQISDTHLGFNKAANPDPVATLHESIAHAKALPGNPAFVIHTGDITHLSKPEQFDMADQILKDLNLPVFHVPGEHDTLDEGNGKVYLERYGKLTNAKGTGYYSFDHSGVHFIALINVVGLQGNGSSTLGADQIKWLADDVAHLKSSTPIVVFAHIPLWDVYVPWGWSTSDAPEAFAHLKRFGSVTVLNGHIHQVIEKVEGNITFHTARSTAYPQPAPGVGPAPGPLTVPAGELHSVLGVREVKLVRGQHDLAIIDRSLATPA
jgi:3',5'-cyclic-AMP phosphodiesterase